MTNIYKALAAVMQDVDHVAKRDINSHQRFNFRGIDAVVNAVGPALRKHGVIVAPIHTDATYESVQTSTGKPATACRLVVTYRFAAEDGSHFDTQVAGEAWDSGDKAAPKANSVTFRTALLQALALPTDEPDPDTQTYTRAAPGPAAPVETGELVKQDPHLKRLFALATDVGLDKDALKAGIPRIVGHDIESTKDLTVAEWQQIIDVLQARKKAAA